MLDPLAHTMTLLGTLPTNDTGSTSAAILRLENLALTQETAQKIPSVLLRDVKLVESTDIASVMILSTILSLDGCL